MRDIEALEAGEVPEDVLADVINDVVRHIEPLEVFGAVQQAAGEDRHPVVREVDVLQLVGDPLGLREHPLGHKRNLVEAEIELPDAETVVKQPVCLVLELLQPVVAEVDGPERHEGGEGPRGDEGQVVMAQVHQDQLQQPLERVERHVADVVVGHGQVEHDGQLAE